MAHLQINSASTIATYLGCININKKKKTKGDLDDIKLRLSKKEVG